VPKLSQKSPHKKRPLTGDARLDQLQAENARLREALEFFPTGMNWAIRRAYKIAAGAGLSDQELLLGSIMLGGEASAEAVSQMLGARQFKPATLQLIFRAMVDLERKGLPCDCVTLSGILEERGQLEAVGGLSYLGSLARDTPMDCQPFEIVGRILRGEP
jgi:hypothetical protein